MTAAFIATLAVVIIVVVVLAVRERSRRQTLDQGRQEITRATEAAAEADQLRAGAEASAQERITAAAKAAAETEATLQTRLTAAEFALSEQRTTSGGRIEGLEHDLHQIEAKRQHFEETAVARAAEVEAQAMRIAELEAHAADAQQSAAPAAGSSPEPIHDDRGGAAAWRLLLARVERQWADVVNAGDDERGVLDGTQGEQLAQAVQRDLERLREEVGVQTTLASSAPVSGDDVLARLLAVGEAVAPLAYHSEQVLVDLGDPAVVSGQDWTGGDDAQRQLERLAAVASEAGLPTTVEVAGHSVDVKLGPLPQDSTQ